MAHSHSHSHSHSADGKVPSEDQISEKWDRCLENLLLNTLYGTLGGLGASILFIRVKRFPSLKYFVFGTGVGGGVSAGYTRCAIDFEAKDVWHGKVVLRRNLVIEPTSPQKTECKREDKSCH